MGKYIKYKRISEILSPKEIEEHFDQFVIEGWEIISYKETTIERTTKFERIHVSIVLGKLNIG